jgi:hypothetical protein
VPCAGRRWTRSSISEFCQGIDHDPSH